MLSDEHACGTSGIDAPLFLRQTNYMGMDGVEIVMAVEEAFDIQIEDQEAETIVTPAQLIDIIVQKVSVTEPAACLSLRAFNLLRRTLPQVSSLQRHQIRPSLGLPTIWEPRERSERLQQLAAALGVPSLPPLRRPPGVSIGVASTVAAGAVAAAVLFSGSGGMMLLRATIAAVLLASLLMVATKELKRDWPPETRTIADLTNWIVRHKADLAIPGQPSWTREQIAARVREIVVDVLGCESAYREDARFVQDLGLG